MRSACHSALGTRRSALISRYLAFLADFLFVTFIGLCENSGCLPHFLTAPFALLTSTLPVQNMHFAQCSCGSLPVLPVEPPGALGPRAVKPVRGRYEEPSGHRNLRRAQFAEHGDDFVDDAFAADAQREL